MIRSHNSSSYNILNLSITHLTQFVANKSLDKNGGSRLQSVMVYSAKRLPSTFNFGILFRLMLTAVWSVDLDVSFCIEIKFARLFFSVLGTWTFIQEDEEVNRKLGGTLPTDGEPNEDQSNWIAADFCSIMVSVLKVQRGERISLNVEWGSFAIQWRHLNTLLTLYDLTDYIGIVNAAVLFIAAETNRTDVSKVWYTCCALLALFDEWDKYGVLELLHLY